MAGIYIHIPFCKSRCTYCDFYTVINETRMDAFVEALCVEIALRKDEIADQPVQTIYFGGGTPSRLQPDHFSAIFEAIYHHYIVEPTAEITVEANPDDLSQGYISLLAQQPVNRLSIGVQSFNDEELKFLSRRHTAQQAIDAVKQSQDKGLYNISVDLMYGLPKQTEKMWQQNLCQATKLGVPHLSAYHLIYEEKTRMHSLLLAGMIQPVSEETSNAMFSMLIDWMTQHGFIHYEISAFGKEGYFSRHNSSYWKSQNYLGLGPAAHSFDGNNRSWNAASINTYINGMKSGEMHRETEQLSRTDKYNEFILTGLRTMWGVDLQELNQRFGEDLYRYCTENAAGHISEKLLEINEDKESHTEKLTLTRKGIFISDGIMSDLMWVD